MPAIRTVTAKRDDASSSVTTRASLPLIARYNGRSVTIPRRINFQHAILSIKGYFRDLEPVEDDKIRVLTRIPTFGEERIYVSPETWDDLVDGLREIWIETNREPEERLELAQADNDDDSTRIQPTTLTFQLTLRGTSQTFFFKCKPTTKVEKLMHGFARRVGVCADDYRASYDGYRVKDQDTLFDLGVEDGDEIDLTRDQVGGKPVIYLYPPIPLSEVNVQLSLVPSWSFSALYPSTPIQSTRQKRCEGDAQTVSWTVSAKPDGTLTDKVSNLEISYLFWEAHTEAPLSSTPPNSRSSSPSFRSEFDPARACDWLKPETSVLLPTNKIASYLDAALKTLTLHTEARTSFITYWLPSLLKHSDVALRFLPQATYEDAAPMSVEPKPDVVTRIFMIFRGVSEGDRVWDEARARAGRNVEEVWKNAVGVDTNKAFDTSLFRVLEWGGMEVLSGY